MTRLINFENKQEVSTGVTHCYGTSIGRRQSRRLFSPHLQPIVDTTENSNYGYYEK